VYGAGARATGAADVTAGGDGVVTSITGRVGQRRVVPATGAAAASPPGAAAPQGAYGAGVAGASPAPIGGAQPSYGLATGAPTPQQPGASPIHHSSGAGVMAVPTSPQSPQPQVQPRGAAMMQRAHDWLQNVLPGSGSGSGSPGLHSGAVATSPGVSPARARPGAHS
jgi:hypothetical protein